MIFTETLNALIRGIEDVGRFSLNFVTFAVVVHD